MESGCLSISLSVCLALTVARQPWTREIEEPRFLVGLQRCPTSPFCCFTSSWTNIPATGCVSLNFISELISGGPVYRDVVKSQDLNKGKVDVKMKFNLDPLLSIDRYV